MARGQDNITRSDEHNGRGIDLADRGWLDEAIREFRKAIDLDPAAAHAHGNLATVLAEKGELLDALFEYVAGVQADPESPGAHHYLGSFLAAHAQELAMAEFRRALELEPDFPEAHLNLALTLADQGKLEEAVTELETAHKQAPDDEMIQHELACCLIDLERYPDAIGHLKRIIRSHPEHVEAYVDLGIAFTAQGFYAESENTLQRALGIDPHDFASHYNLAALYAVWSKPDEAFEHLALASRQDKDQARLWAQEDPLFDSVRDDERFQRSLDIPPTN